jgi:hypothetical protein
MAKILEQIDQISTSTDNKIKPASWYQQQIRQLGLNTVNTQKLLQTGKLTTRVIPGYMYLFKYDPKDKNIPYYDMFPLVIPFRRVNTGFFGINFHYLPFMIRLNILKEFEKYASSKDITERTRVRLSYRLIESSRVFRFVSPAIRQYNNQQLRSRLLMIPFKDWKVASQLPVQKFRKATMEKAIRDTIKKSRIIR